MEIQAIKFKNFTNEDFTHTFDKVPYTFKAGMEMYMEDYKAHHFAKHLIDRECNKAGIATNNLAERAKFEAQCFPSDEVITPLEAMQIEAPKKKKKAVAKEEFEK